jgi:hypothetical protein
MSNIARFATNVGLILAIGGVTIMGSLYRPPLLDTQVAAAPAAVQVVLRHG